jgi:hypothetical protein
VPADLNLPRIQRVGSRDYLDQGRFPRAVFAEQSMHFAGLQGEGNAPQRPHRTEGFGDIAKLEERGHRGGVERAINRKSGNRESKIPTRPFFLLSVAAFPILQAWPFRPTARCA